MGRKSRRRLNAAAVHELKPSGAPNLVAPANVRARNYEPPYRAFVAAGRRIKQCLTCLPRKDTAILSVDTKIHQATR